MSQSSEKEETGEDRKQGGKFLFLKTFVHPRRLWLRGRASVLLLEGCWFDSPVKSESVLGQDTESQAALCMAAPISV